MDELKQSVQLAVHEQKDPLLIYKFEAFELFKKMVENVNKDVLSFLFKGELPKENQRQIQEAREVKSKQKLNEQKDEIQNLDQRSVGPRQLDKLKTSRQLQKPLPEKCQKLVVTTKLP